MLDEMAAGTSFTRIEEEIRRFWRRRDIPELGRIARRDGQPYLIYQEPLAVAGQSWIDQARLLSTTDLLARYRAMRGDSVCLQIGWACHGLRVEVAVERSLAEDPAAEPTAQHPASAKQSAIAQFNTACCNAAAEGLRQGEHLVEQLGVWSDPSSTCLSCTSQAIATVWGALHTLWDAGQLSAEQGVVPVCPRCATPLSTSESARRTVQAETRSLWVRLPWAGEPGAYLLAWSPAPWTLVGMVALAAHPGADYVLIELIAEENSSSERLLLAKDTLATVPTGDYRLVKSIRGRALRDAQYRPPFTFLPADQGTGRVILSKDVPLDRGTGLQILTPAFDAPSFELAKAHGIAVPRLLDDGGVLDSTVMRWRGLSPLDAEPLLIEDLRTRGLLFRDSPRTQARSLCPYCETPLLPLARDVWQVHAGDGPWIIGRDRAWGVPLPIWVCEDCAEQVCVAGLDDLAHRAGLDVQQIDPHRPAVDTVTFPCRICRGTMRRVEPVVDAAFEASVLALSSWPSGGPVSASTGSLDPVQGEGSARRLAVGLGEQGSSWLGDLSKMAALLEAPQVADRTVALPEPGTMAPWEQDRHVVRNAPADALRWATYMRITPEQAELGFLQPVWQLAADLQTGDAHPNGEGAKGARDDLLGRWLNACLHQAIEAITGALDAGDAHQAAGVLDGLVRDLSTWYTLRQSGGPRTVVAVLSQLLAPFLPHLAEAIHRRLFKSTEDSVHLGAWPEPEPAWADPELVAQMSQVQRLAALGETSRARAGIGPDLPLRHAFVDLGETDASGIESLAPLKDLLAEMLGVARVQFVGETVAPVRWQLDPQEQAGERGTLPSTIRAALGGLSSERAAEMAAQLGSGLSVGLEIKDQTVTLLPDEVSISIRSEPGWIAAEGSGQVVALKLAQYPV